MNNYKINEEEWIFSKVSNLDSFVFNADLQKFESFGISGLVRENIQNSLDAKIVELDEPVIVSIKTGKIKTKDVPGIEKIKKHIESLKGGNVPTIKICDLMNKVINSDESNYISFEDNNTKGLTERNWDSYAYKTGSHLDEGNSEKEMSRGGSHGIGKIASNSSSDLNLMFFANCDENGMQKIGGTIHLIDHSCNGELYRSTGYFTDKNELNEFVPFDNIYKDVFVKNTRGLKIVIPFVRNSYMSQEKIILSICENFFLAILNGKLTVTVDDDVVDAGNIVETVANLTEQDENNLTKFYINTYLTKEPDTITVKDANGVKYDFDMYFDNDENIKRFRIAIVRNIGMKINEKRLKNYSNYPYNMVVIPKTYKEDALLKSFEDTSHTNLSTSLMRNEEEMKNGDQFLANFYQTFRDFIKEKETEKHLISEELNTDELIYIINNKFEKVLKKSISTVSITPSGQTEQNEIVKMGTNKKQGNQGTKKPTIKKKNRLRDKTGAEKEKGVNTESIETSLVNRIVTKDGKEKLKINLNELPSFNGESICNIHIKLVDGLGEVTNDYFELDKYYSEIIDKNCNKKCVTVVDKIQNVSINNGIILLNMVLNHDENNAFKFKYLVEVNL